jgi:RNA methyltransferase, TrmH family
MIFPELTSKDNPIIKTIRKISDGSPKSSELLVAVEGIRVLEEATLSGCGMEAVLLSEQFGSSSREKNLLNSWQDARIRIFRIKESLFKTLSGVQTPQGAIAIARVPKKTLKEASPGMNAFILCALGLQDPGNIGTLIRTAMAAGADMVCTTKGTVSVRNPKALRSSAGAFFRIPVIEQVEADEFLNYCRKRNIQMYRTDARNGIEYTKADLISPCAILLGNEGNGITDEEFSGIPSLHIPMAENTESLNVAIAGAILLFEAFRQRRNLKDTVAP